MENSVTPSFTAATTATIITTTHMPVVWCGVVWWVFMYGDLMRVDSWCLCLHLNTHGLKERGGGENSDWSQSFF